MLTTPATRMNHQRIICTSDCFSPMQQGMFGTTRTASMAASTRCRISPAFSPKIFHTSFQYTNTSYQNSSNCSRCCGAAIPPTSMPPIDDILIEAIIAQESEGDDHAIGDRHLTDHAYGPMQ